MENILREFLTSLGFTVYTFRDARSTPIFQSEIYGFIDRCPIFLAFLTKDIEEKNSGKWHPSGNIPDEIGRALAPGNCEHVIIYHEKGVTIPTNIKSHYCRPFRNESDRYAELLIDLIKVLHKEQMFP